jgi:putative cell wall-binding protein
MLRLAAVVGGSVALLVSGVTTAQALPSAAAADGQTLNVTTATAVTPVTENITPDDIQYADDESQPQRNGWFWLRYDQRGPGAQAEIARDLSPEAHGDGSLRLVTRTTDDEVAVRRLTAAPRDPRLPLADVVSGGFDVLVGSGAAPSFVIEVTCRQSASYLYGDVRLTYAGPMPTGPGWHTVDVVQGGAATWARRGSSTLTTLGDVARECPIGTIIDYGVQLTSPGDARIDNVSLNDVVSNFRQPVLERVGGADRLMTACALAGRRFTPLASTLPQFPDPYADPWAPRTQARTLVLANDTSYADSLAAGPLAAILDAPLLLNHGTGLDTGPCTLVAPGTTAYIVGGEGVVSRATESTLRSQGVATVRIGGKDRYATAVAVAKAIDGLRPDGASQQVFLASGTDFPDALSAGAPAGTASGAVLLTQGSRMAAATAAYLAGRPDATVYAVGGPAAAAATLPTSNELVGANRYATATIVADRFFPEPTTAAFASGADYPDALSAAAYGGDIGAPVLLVAPSAVPDVVSGYAQRHRATLRGSVLLGGTGAVSDATFDRLSAALTPSP